MALFPDLTAPASYRAKARRELRRVSQELEIASERARALRQAATANPDLAFKAIAAEVRVAALRARAAQLRRAAGVLDRAA
jgi:hypothetical protein